MYPISTGRRSGRVLPGTVTMPLTSRLRSASTVPGATEEENSPLPDPRVCPLLPDRGRAPGWWVLRSLSPQELIGEVLKALGDRRWAVRRAAVEAFGKLVTRDDLPHVQGMLKDNDEDVRRAAVEAFTRLGSSEEIEAVLDAEQEELPLHVLTAFDWHLYAPDFVKAAYAQPDEQDADGEA